MGTMKILCAILLSYIQFIESISGTCIVKTETTKVYVTPQPSHYSYNYQRGQWQEKMSRLEFSCESIYLPFAKEEVSKMDECTENCEIILRIMSLKNKTILPLTFVGLNKVNVLYLENLHIEHLASATFNFLSLLTKISLSKNNISDVDVTTFYTLSKLEVLDLSFNNIKYITPHFLMGNKCIRDLNLSYNLLKNFDGSLLHTIYPVSIDVSNNLISSMTLNISLSFVQKLNVSNNILSELKGCWNNYENIYVRQNNLKAAPMLNCNSSDSKLLYLDLGQNSISEVSNQYTKAEISLKYLLLDHNYLSNLPQRISEQFPALNTLNLSFNHLRKLEYGAFDHFEHLHNLDLSHNELSSIRRYIHNLISLNILDISDNKLTYLNATHLSEDLPQLKKIHLDKNNFSCEDLIKFIHGFKLAERTIVAGQTRASANVQGIACVEANEDSDLIKKIENLLSHKLSHLLKNDTSVYDYLNTDFKNSNFYKYLESLQQQKTLNLNATELINYFNRDFTNSTFYKHLESLRVPNATNVSETFVHYFNEDFKNSYFVKYLENFKKTDYNFKGGFNTSVLYNFFNDNFRHSNFFKYMEGFKNNVYVNKKNSIPENNDLDVDNVNTNYLIVITFCQLVIAFGVCFLVGIRLRHQYLLYKHHSHLDENIVLSES